MAFELRFRGKTERFETSGEAEERAREIIQDNADATVEIFNLSTGWPYAPAASQQDREALAKKI